MNKYQCLTRIWVVLCDEHGLPKDTPFPRLSHHSDEEMEEAEERAFYVTMGDLDLWLNGYKLSNHTELTNITDDLEKEIDNV